MWAVKVKGENVYYGQCVIPQPGLTTCRFPGNDIYKPVQFLDEAMARAVSDRLNSSLDSGTFGKWEVVPYPKEASS